VRRPPGEELARRRHAAAGRHTDTSRRRSRAALPESRPAVEEEAGAETLIEPPWVTILWNCDCHTFEQVARQLMKAIGCSYEDGMAVAWRVHNDGKAVVRAGPREECERVARILAEIGLRVTVVES
jgi:ATP-dependent Clp protease adaptor protein ClpS